MENGPVGLAPGPWFASTPTHGVPVLTARSTGKHTCTSRNGWLSLNSCYQLALVSLVAKPIYASVVPICSDEDTVGSIVRRYSPTVVSEILVAAAISA